MGKLGDRGDEKSTQNVKKQMPQLYQTLHVVTLECENKIENIIPFVWRVGLSSFHRLHYIKCHIIIILRFVFLFAIKCHKLKRRHAIKRTVRIENDHE